MVKIKQCESCGLSSSSSTFKNMKAFNNHFESHQSNLKCHEKDCDKTFATRAKLKWHRKTVHATPVNCQCCNKVFKTDALLKNHLKEKDFKENCQFCEKEFLNPRSLKRHLLSNESAEEYKCDECEKIFLTKLSLNDHHYSSHSSNMVKTYLNV